jgi:hypothetical protein
VRRVRLADCRFWRGNGDFSQAFRISPGIESLDVGDGLGEWIGAASMAAALQ